MKTKEPISIDKLKFIKGDKLNLVSIYIWGKSGIGKTFKLKEIYEGIALNNKKANEGYFDLDQNKGVRRYPELKTYDYTYQNCADLERLIKDSGNNDESEGLSLKKFDRDILLLDDLGVEHIKGGENDLYAIFERRQGKINIITSNYSIEELRKHGAKSLDPVVVDRLISRLYGMVVSERELIGKDKRQEGKR